MIRVTDTNLEGGYFSDIFMKLLVETSELPLKAKPRWYPENIKPYFDILYKACNCTYNLEDEDKDIPKFDIPESKKILVGFTAGKDSTAVTLKSIEMGYEPILFHITGLNRSYPHEKDFAIEMANKIGVPIEVRELKITGKNDFIESPVRNQLVVACMVDYGIKQGIHRFVLGNVKEDILDLTNYLMELSDIMEMFDGADIFFKDSIPNYERYNMLETKTESYYTVLRMRPDLQKYLSGCITPDIYTKSLRAKNEAKYNVKIMNGRCGSCYKCCGEYVFLVEAGALKKNQAFYDHCIDIMRSKAVAVFPKYQLDPKSERSVIGAFLDWNLLDKIKGFYTGLDFETNYLL